MYFEDSKWFMNYEMNQQFNYKTLYIKVLQSKIEDIYYT